MSKLTEVQKLQKELDEMNARFEATKKANTVKWDGPASKRNAHTYHKGVILRSLV